MQSHNYIIQQVRGAVNTVNCYDKQEVLEEALIKLEVMRDDLSAIGLTGLIEDSIEAVEYELEIANRECEEADASEARYMNSEYERMCF